MAGDIRDDFERSFNAISDMASYSELSRRALPVLQSLRDRIRNGPVFDTAQDGLHTIFNAEPWPAATNTAFQDPADHVAQDLSTLDFSYWTDPSNNHESTNFDPAALLTTGTPSEYFDPLAPAAADPLWQTMCVLVTNKADLNSLYWGYGSATGATEVQDA